MAQPESQLSRKIMEYIRSRGHFCFKVHGGPMQMSGMPDILACIHGQFVGFETKRPSGGDPTPIQLQRHREIKAAQGLVRVVRSVKDAADFIDVIDHANGLYMQADGTYKEL